jgi:hypothetical protein
MRDTIDTTMYGVDQLQSSNGTWYGLMAGDEYTQNVTLRDTMCHKCGGDHECRTDHRKRSCELCGYSRK